MTVSSTTNRKSFTGDAVTTSFGTSPVVFFNSSELVVQVITTATGAATTLTENTHYTVTGGSGSTGTVSLAGGSSPYGAPSASQTLLIRRVLPLTQADDFVNNDINDAEVTEARFDKTVMQIQQLDEEIGRGLVIPASETTTDALITLPFDRASKYLAFDSNKELIATSGTDGVGAVPVSTFMETVLDDTSAADARTTLGAAASGLATASGLTMTTSRVLGRTTASTGAVEELSAAAPIALSGGALTTSMATSRLLGRTTAGTGVAQEISVSGNLSLAGQTLTATAGTQGTLAASTSGTEVLFSSLPAGIKRITLMLDNVSTNGTSNLQVQLGDSGGIESSGYTSLVVGMSNGSTGSGATSTAGIALNSASVAARATSGVVVFVRMDSATNLWAAHGTVGDATVSWTVSGVKALSAELDRIRLTTASGADTFDAGNVNIFYEF